MTPRLKRELAAEYFNLGNAYFELKKYDRAITLYEKSLRYDPSFSEGSYNLARVYMSQEKYEDGLGILENLISREGENLLLLQTYAYALGKAGRSSEAIAFYREILSKSEGNLAALFNLSVLLENDESTGESYELLKKANTLFPEDPDVLKRLGKLEAELGSLSAAINYLRQYIEKKKNDNETAFLLVELYGKERLYSDALELLETLIGSKRDDPKFWFEKAYLQLCKAEEKSAGIDSLNKAIELGYKNKEGARKLLLEVPSAFLRDVQSIILEKAILTPEEMEKTFADVFDEF
jgi:tetratricopeptide (TPR) repeat protein